MPHPPRSSLRCYSNSTVWWICPLCPKACKSKGGRTWHISQKHGNFRSNQSSQPTVFHAETLARSHRESSSPDPQEEYMDAPEQTNISSALPPEDDMPSDASQSTPRSELMFDNMTSDNPPVFLSSPLADDASMSENPFDPSARASKSTISSETYHPIINGELCSRYCRSFGINSSLARPCDKHGNFLDNSEPPQPPQHRDCHG